MITALTFAPAVAALLIVLLPRERREEMRLIALGGALFSLVMTLSAIAMWGYTADPLTERVGWITALGIDYHVGLDGLNALVLLLAALLAPLAVLASWRQKENPKVFFALLSLQFTGLFGAFTALNFFHWFLFWEAALVPAFFLIKMFGHGENRHGAALNFFLLTVLGSVAMLVGFLVVYHETGTFDFLALAEMARTKPIAISSLAFCGILAGLWVKVPLVPLHIWQAPAYAAAPTPVVMLLTGVMSKMGVYAFLRIVVEIFPHQLSTHAAGLLGFALVTILWGAFLALRQTDLKKVLAFSSLNHVAYCILGVGALGVALTQSQTILVMDERALALQGVILQMFAHGLSAAGLFYLVGVLEERTGQRGLHDFGGLSRATPRFAAAFYILTFCSLGLPFLAGFAAEFLIFSGAFAVASTVTVLATLGLLATAVFLLTMLQRIFTGPTPDRLAEMPDLSPRETLVLLPILILVFWAGIAPGTFINLGQSAVQGIVDLSF